MRASITYLACGHREDIVSIYPWADQSEDTSGEVPDFQLVGLGLAESGLVEVNFNLFTRCLPLLPRGRMKYTPLMQAINRSTEEVTAVDRAKLAIDPEVRLWFLLTCSDDGVEAQSEAVH